MTFKMSDKDVILFFFPSSFYSLKAVLALYEKNVKFTEKIVRTFQGEQTEQWFMKINPNGQVPVLELGGKYYPESDVIINLVDEISGCRLVPNKDTVLGKRVSEMRAMLDEVPVFLVSYGSLVNPSMLVDEPSPFMKRITKESMVKLLSDIKEKLIKNQQNTTGELRKAYDRKIETGVGGPPKFLDESFVREALDKLEQTFDKISEQLKQTMKDAGDNTDFWLCGSTFTAADITATVLLFRLKLIGMASRYFSDKTRPEINAYYQKVMQRPSVKKMVEKFETAKLYMNQ